MKNWILCLSVLFCTSGIAAQEAAVPTSMQEVLDLVRQNNKALQAGDAQTASLKWQSKAENNLPNPEVTYSHLWGNREGMGFTGEFIASQAFDFPTLYAQRGKLHKVRAASFDARQAALRQQVLLQAQQACLDLVYLNQLESLLKDRLANAEELSRFYASRLERGDANVIETNKIDLELLNARNEYRQNEIARKAKLEELTALNGGRPLAFADTVYRDMPEMPADFEAFRLEALDALPEIQSLRQEQLAAQRQLTVSKQQWLPGLTLGYRMNPSSGGERFNGVLVGISIPLFSNRHKVKQAKADRFFADMQLDNTTETTLANLRQLWNRAHELKTSADEYARVLRQQDNMRLLNKAIQSGQMSMVDYFVNLSTIYQSMQNYLQVQNEYQKAVAELYKFRL